MKSLTSLRITKGVGVSDYIIGSKSMTFLTPSQKDTSSLYLTFLISYTLVIRALWSLSRIIIFESVDTRVKGHGRVIYVFSCVYFIYLLIKWFSGVFPNIGIKAKVMSSIPSAQLLRGRLLWVAQLSRGEAQVDQVTIQEWDS